jgi:hypothetical protein
VTWGVSPAVKEALFSYPDSKDYTISYTKLNISGNILMLGGLVVMSASVFVPIIIDDWSTTNGEPSLSLKIMLGGFIGSYVSVLTGSFLTASAQKKSFQGINIYNRHKISEYK